MFARDAIPYSDGPVGASRDDATAVRTELRAREGPPIGEGWRHRLAGRGVPHARRTAVSGREHSTTIRAERHIIRRCSDDRGELSSRGCIPDAEAGRSWRGKSYSTQLILFGRHVQTDDTTTVRAELSMPKLVVVQQGGSDRFTRARN